MVCSLNWKGSRGSEFGLGTAGEAWNSVANLCPTKVVEKPTPAFNTTIPADFVSKLVGHRSVDERSTLANGFFEQEHSEEKRGCLSITGRGALSEGV